MNIEKKLKFFLALAAAAAIILGGVLLFFIFWVAVLLFCFAVLIGVIYLIFELYFRIQHNIDQKTTEVALSNFQNKQLVFNKEIVDLLEKILCKTMEKK